MIKFTPSGSWKILGWCLFLTASLSGSLTAQSYCIPATNSSEIYIAHFNLQTIENFSGNDGYTNYPLYATLFPGQTYPFQITMPASSGGVMKYYALYADFNDNGSFSDPGELVASGSTTALDVPGNLTVPLSAAGLISRIRVIAASSPIVGPCSAVDGEVEDYGVVFPEDIGDDDWDIWIAAGGYQLMPSPFDENGCIFDMEFQLYLDKCAASNVNAQPAYLDINLHELSPLNNWNCVYSTPASFLSVGSQAVHYTDNTYCSGLSVQPGKTYVLGARQNLHLLDQDCKLSGYDSLAVTFVVHDQCSAATIHSITGFNFGDPSKPDEPGDDEPSDRQLDAGAASRSLQGPQLFPNPARDQSTLSFELTEATEVRIRLLDLLGRPITGVMSPGILGKGSHQLPLSLADLPAGSYWVMLETTSSISSLRLVLVR